MEFRGTERFELLAPLGRGATGVVFEAFDREQQARVALKVLTRATPESIAYFKNEFRALQGIVHSNLVELKELLCAEGYWFLTMELVRGVDIVAYSRGAMPGPSRAGGPPCMDATPGDETLLPGSVASTALLPMPALGSSLSEERLRGSFEQLARGLAALHAANKIHRDLKRSNVLATAEGRVVALDFGLVAELGAQGSIENDQLLGTPHYMSPEQAALESVGPPSDWYGLGVMLYEALTGVTPFRGTRETVLAAKARLCPVAPAELNAEAPEDLSDLAMDLLEIEPGRRPAGKRVIARLSAREGAVSSRRLPFSAPPDTTFIGRERELALLDEAFARARAGESLSVVVQGESGLGKTSLVSRFLAQLGERGERMQSFLGRCYERESLPYKALDGVLDAVCRRLAELPLPELQRLLPENHELIEQAFPAFGAVERLVSPPSAREQVEPHVQRRRIFVALRELLIRLSRERPTIVVMDDMQWSDIDSWVLLASLLEPPSAPNILWILLRRPASGQPQIALPGEVMELELGPLSHGESSQLVAQLLAQAPVDTGDRALELAREARGHPLFLREMVRLVQSSNGPSAPERLDDALWRRISSLAPRTRGLMELTALAGRPIAQGTLAEAWTLAGETALAAGAEPRRAFASSTEHIAELRHASLIRTSGPHPHDSIEPYHDRVREAVLAHLEPAARAMQHGLLARALENAEPLDAEALAIHWQGAGQPRKARSNAALAADQAAEVLAFERAARLYRMALELGPMDATLQRSLARKLADALANAGRGLDAAEAYQSAAQGDETLRGLELRCLAAEQLLRSGYVERGIELVSQVMREMGVKTHRRTLGSLLSLATLRARIRLRGFGYRRREEREIPPFELARIDATWIAATCLNMFDNVRSAELSCQSTLFALRAGTPLQVLRAHTSEALFTALGGQSGRPRIERLLRAATRLAEQIAQPHATAWVALSRGASAFFLGDWRLGEEQCRAAEVVFHRRAGALFELSSARAFGVWSSMMRGEFRNVLERVPEYVAEAENRGDLFGATVQMTGFSNVAWLSKDDVAEARRMLALAESRWPSARFDVPLYLNLVAAAHVELYDRTGLRAYRRVVRDWRPLRWGVAFRAQITRFGMRFVRGLTALAAFDETRERALLRDAEACARAIAAERVEWSRCFSEILLAGTACRHGRTDLALGHLQRAEQKADASGMALHRAVVRHRRGELTGGDAGRELCEEAMRFMHAQQIRNPQRMLDMLSPSARGR